MEGVATASHNGSNDNDTSMRDHAHHLIDQVNLDNVIQKVFCATDKARGVGHAD
jgi:hypothetical protein